MGHFGDFEGGNGWTAGSVENMMETLKNVAFRNGRRYGGGRPSPVVAKCPSSELVSRVFVKNSSGEMHFHDDSRAFPAAVRLPGAARRLGFRVEVSELLTPKLRICYRCALQLGPTP